MNVIQFPPAADALPVREKRSLASAGRPEGKKSANPFDADYRSEIICAVLFGERNDGALTS
jgi:hypothetical protein